MWCRIKILNISYIIQFFSSTCPSYSEHQSDVSYQVLIIISFIYKFESFDVETLDFLLLNRVVSRLKKGGSFKCVVTNVNIMFCVYNNFNLILTLFL